MPRKANTGPAVIGKLEPQPKLAELMAEQGWTNTELAKHVGVDRNTIRNIISGNYRTSQGIALAICEVLEVEWEQVFSYRLPTSKGAN